MSWQPLIRKNSYLEHNFPVVSFHFMTSDARVHDLGRGLRSKSRTPSKCGIYCVESKMLARRLPQIGLSFVSWHQTPGSLSGGWAFNQNLVHL